jgi:hypothetical protein
MLFVLDVVVFHLVIRVAPGVPRLKRVPYGHPQLPTLTYRRTVGVREIKETY